MEPDNFEDNLRERLESRRIQPSQKGWQQLSQQLDESTPKPVRKLYWGLGIAASIILILSLGYNFYEKDVHHTPPQLVQNPAQTNTEEPATFENTVVDVQTTTKVAQELDTELEQPTAKNPKVINRQPVHQSEAIASNKPTSTQDIQIPLQYQGMSFSQPTIVKSELAQAVVTDAEVDSLLKQAERELLLSPIQKPNELTSADALLEEVEFEIEASFRSKMLDALKKGYSSVKTTVAQRNQ